MERLSKLHGYLAGLPFGTDYMDPLFLESVFREYVSFDELNIGFLQEDGNYNVFSFGDTFETYVMAKSHFKDWKYVLREREYFDESDAGDGLVSRVYGEYRLEELAYFIQVVTTDGELRDVESVLVIEMLKTMCFRELNRMYYAGVNVRLSDYEQRDNLTKLYNRKKFLSDMNYLIANKLTFSLFRMKIMSLHKINAVFGNRVGDEMLGIFAARLKNVPELKMYRIDGSEFMLVCDVEDEEKIRARLLSELNRPVRCMSNRLKVEAFIGLIRHEDLTETYTDLEFNSSVALEHGKILGVNKVGSFKKELKVKKMMESRIAEALPKAIEGKDFKLHYQAQLSLDDKRPIGLEALLRWKLDGEYVSPMQFIPIAEEHGYILDIGYVVFEEACRYQRRLLSEGIDLSVAVNVSVRQVLDEEFVTRIQEIVTLTGVDVTRIDIEITESMDVGNDSVIDEKIGKLKAMGFKIVMDDFGTGYSSLGYLRNGIFDKLKIDREFIKNITTDQESEIDKMLLVSMIDLAEGVGMVVVVEGVETYEQVKFLEGTKCNIVQGFVYSRPIDGDSMLAYLKESGITG